MSELTKEDLEILEKLKKSEDNVRLTLDKNDESVLNPEKYSFPIGMDDEGNLNVVEAENDSKSGTNE